MKEVGRYNLGNDTFINSNNSSLLNVDVTLHEKIHKDLCVSSSYGLLTIMLNKNNAIYRDMNWLLDFLSRHMKRMQEIIATGIELLNVYSVYGKSEYINRLTALKSNPTYYNYYRKLHYCGLKINNQEEIENIINKLFAIGVLSLNIDLTKIPFESINTEKEFQVFLSKENNNIKFIPNRRFETLLVKLLMNNVPENIINKEKLIYETTFTSFDNNALKENALYAIEKVYSNSSLCATLMERAKTIGRYEIICNKDINNEYLSAYPIDFESYKQIPYKKNIIETNIFLSELNNNNNNNNNKVVRFEHLLAGFENIPLISIWDLSKSELTTTRYDMDFFDYYVKACKYPIIFMQKKLFSKVKYKIKGLSFKLPIYLLMDSCIGSNLDFIYKHFSHGNYTYFGDNSVTLIIYRGSYVLIQFIIKNLIDQLDILLTESKNIKYVPYDNSPLNKVLIESISREGLKLTAHSLNLLDKKKE